MLHSQGLKEFRRRVSNGSLVNYASPKHWAELYFPGCHITSNIAESLNSTILEAREKPILEMFKHICIQLMEWYEKCRKINSSETILGLKLSSLISLRRFKTSWLSKPVATTLCLQMTLFMRSSRSSTPRTMSSSWNI